MKTSELLLNDANLIAISADEKGHIKYVSAAVEKISGYKTENLLGDLWWENTYCNKKDGLAFKQNVIKILSNKSPINGKVYERRMLCKDGSCRWIEWRDSLGANNNFVSVGVDISDWKKKEEHKIQSEAILKNIPSIVLVSNKNGEIIFVSPSIEKILGYTANEVLGRNWWQKVFLSKNKAEDAKEAINNYIFSNKGSYLDIFKQKLKTKEGLDKWIEWQYSKGVNDTYISIGSDITDRILQDFELKKAKEAAEESVQVKNEFLANMSHEIRTPLNAVIGFTDLLLETTLTTEQRQHLETMHTSGEILLTLINNVLDLSKLESNKFEIEKTSFNLKRTLNEVVKLMRVKAQEKGISLDLIINSNTPSEVVSDSNRISQILLNLIGNAIKFTDKGGVTITVVKIEENDKIATISFEIKDTGIGIVSNKINSVFGAFTQAKNDTSRIYGGTGLGLTIVKKLINLLNGEIKVESVFGKGSTFTMVLPLKIGEKNSSKINAEKSKEEVNDKNLGYSILLVEDNKTNQLLAKTRLQRWNCTVDIADNGFEGVKKTQQQLYDIIMMDIQMPVMDGYEATKIIKNDISEEVSKIPIIAMTAFTSKTEIKRALEAGMDDYIFKPFKPDELFKILKKYGDHPKIIEPTMKNEVKRSYKHINLEFLEKETLNESTVLVLLIELFFKDLKAYMQLLDEKVKLKKWQDLYKETHKIKPSISMFGITKLEPIVFSLEQKFKEEIDLEDVDSLVKKGKSIIVNVKKELKIELKSLRE
ncbi:response regulator [Lutibacter sp.]|uniref:response regulator n=1 Tax=Lutibacter sp. TaxID=1925666 RepID=UPI0025BF9041|nr:response regulator [Lutibacter sp.]MCF6180489.1 ATP-binding protein [Lutibacter sp.]